MGKLVFSSGRDQVEFEKEVAELQAKLDEKVAVKRAEMEEVIALRAVHFEGLYEASREILSACNGKCSVPWLSKHLLDTLAPSASNYGLLSRVVADFIRTNSAKDATGKAPHEDALFKTVKGPQGGIEFA